MADQPTSEPKIPQPLVDESQKAKKKRKGLIFVTGGILIFLLTLSSVFFFAPSFLPAGINPFHKEKEVVEKKPSIPSLQGHIYNLDSMIVNLADTEFPRYLKIKIDLESEQTKPNEEFDKRLPQLKDTILSILTGKTYAEIVESKGKLQLKEEILAEANQLFETVKIKKVYFTEFVVQ